MIACNHFVGSLELGVASCPVDLDIDRPRDLGRDIEILERWLEDVVTSYADRVLPIDGRVADAWGRFGAVRPIRVIDGLLAATARVHDMTLVTRNAPDVEGLGVPVLNPFDA